MNELADIRTLPAGPELDLAFARVVGLPVICFGEGGHISWRKENGEYPPDPFVYYYAGGGCLFSNEDNLCDRCTPEWCPSTDTGQALDYASRYLCSHGFRWELIQDKHPERFRFRAFNRNPDDNQGDSVSVDQIHPTISLAVVRGVLLVAESLKEKP